MEGGFKMKEWITSKIENKEEGVNVCESFNSIFSEKGYTKYC